MQIVPQSEPVHAILSEPVTGLEGVEHSLPCTRTVDSRHAVKGLEASGSGRMRMSHLLLTSKRACMSVRVEAQKASLSFPQPRYASVLRMPNMKSFWKAGSLQYKHRMALCKLSMSDLNFYCSTRQQYNTSDDCLAHILLYKFMVRYC